MRILKIFLILLTINLVSITRSNAQAIVDDSGGVIYLNKMDTPESLAGKRGAYFGEHFLGEDIKNKYSKFMSYYVEYKTGNGAYATEQQIIHKKRIYKAVYDLDKYYKKAVRKNEITLEQARSEFSEILSQAIKLRFAESSMVEKMLQNAKSDEQLIEIFQNVKFE